jgi:hypothetical protein
MSVVLGCPIPFVLENRTMAPFATVVENGMEIPFVQPTKLCGCAKVSKPSKRCSGSTLRPLPIFLTPPYSLDCRQEVFSETIPVGDWWSPELDRLPKRPTLSQLPIVQLPDNGPHPTKLFAG